MRTNRINFFFLYITSAVLLFAVIFGFNQVNFSNRSKAYTDPSITPANVAETEKSFIHPVYQAYLSSTTLRQDYDPFIRTMKQTGSTIGLYRGLCMQLVIAAVEKNGGQTASEPAVQLFSSVYDNGDFTKLTSIATDSHVVAVPLSNCLYGIILNHNQLKTALTSVGKDISGVYREIAQTAVTLNTKYIPSWYQTAFINKGDTPFEEVTSMIVFLNAAAKLIPDEYLAPSQKTALTANINKLIPYSTSQCAVGCPFQPGKYTVANHQMDPNPHYGLSGLAEYADLFAVSPELRTQLNAPISAILSAHRNQLIDGETFGYKGSYTYIPLTGISPAPSYAWNKLTYTFRNPDFKGGITSSVPTEGINDFNEYFQPGTTNRKVYITKNDRIWHYECPNNTSCRASYTMVESDRWTGIGNQPAAGWNTNPPPSVPDAETRYRIPNTDITAATVWKGNRVWTYICNPSCNAVMTKTLSEISGISAYSIKPEFRDFNAVSQIVNPSNTAQLKTYFYKGGTVWQIICSPFYAKYTDCTAQSEESIAAKWGSLPNYTVAWNGRGYPLQTSNLDAVSQYIAPDASIVTNIFKGSTWWQFTCTSGSCKATDAGPISSILKPIQNQYLWTYDFTDDTTKQMSGVTEWGLDATFLNAAFTAGYLADSPQFSSYYINLLSTEKKRGYATRPPLPVAFDVNGQWQFSGRVLLTSADYITSLADGWMPQSKGALINAHWWFNIFSAYWHSIAYLNVTDGLLFKTALQARNATATPISNTPTTQQIPPTPNPTFTPKPIPTNTPITPPNTLLPTDRFTDYNEFYPPNSNVRKVYISKDDRLWHVQCPNDTACTTAYTVLHRDRWSAIGNHSPAGWSSYPPPDYPDTETRWVKPNTAITVGTLWKGNRIWTYECEQSCNAVMTKTLSEIPGISALGIQDFQAISQFVNPSDATQLKTYFFKGGTVWQVICSPSLATYSGCYKASEEQISAKWGSLSNYQNAWTGKGNPLAVQDLDAVSQYVKSDKSIVTNIFKNSTWWQFVCSNGVCTATDSGPLQTPHTR